MISFVHRKGLLFTFSKCILVVLLKTFASLKSTVEVELLSMRTVVLM